MEDVAETLKPPENTPRLGKYLKLSLWIQTSGWGGPHSDNIYYSGAIHKLRDLIPPCHNFFFILKYWIGKKSRNLWMIPCLNIVKWWFSGTIFGATAADSVTLPQISVLLLSRTDRKLAALHSRRYEGLRLDDWFRKDSAGEKSYAAWCPMGKYLNIEL